MNRLEIRFTETESPRYDENITKMVCFHGRYDLGDKTTYLSRDYNSFEELKKDILKKENVIEILPIYMYEHSGVTIKTSPFHCQWDSGQLGYVYITREDMNNYLGEKRATKEVRKRLIDIIEAEIKEYDTYLRGEVYAVEVISPEGEVLDGIHGLLGFEAVKDAVLHDIDRDLFGGISDNKVLTLFHECEVKY